MRWRNGGWKQRDCRFYLVYEQLYREDVLSYATNYRKRIKVRQEWTELQRD
jgi:hypothetical protein